MMQMESEYVSCADTAKLLRKALKEHFPGFKFSVRSNTYSGGASIDVRWTDGPRTKVVEPIVKVFEGADFDGMIDLKTYKRHYITEDGVVGLASAQGTLSSRGTIPPEENPVPDGARLVNFLANYIFCTRDVSDFDAKVEEAAKLIRSRCVTTGELPHDRFGDNWVSDLARGVARDYGSDETMEAGFRRVVLRETE